MSLEAAIQENTQAIYHLINFLHNSAQVTVADNGTSGDQPACASSVPSLAEEVGETAVSTEPSPEAVGAAETAPVAETPETVETVMVDDIVALKTKAGKSLTKISQNLGKEKAYEILNSLGYEKFTDVKVDDYTKIITLCAEAA